MSDAELNAVIAVLGTIITIVFSLYGGAKVVETVQRIKNNPMLMEGYRDYYKSLPEGSRSRQNIDSVDAFLNQAERALATFGTSNPLYKLIDAMEDIGDEVTGTVDKEPDAPQVPEKEPIEATPR